jgi:hypothetical protein
MSGEFQITGTNNAAPFTLNRHRGDGVVLLAMDYIGPHFGVVFGG